MLEKYFSAPKTLRRLRTGPSGPYIDGFADALESAGYQSNKQDFQAVLTAFLDVLHLDEDYWQNLAEYETAVARLEQMTGLALR